MIKKLLSLVLFGCVIGLSTLAQAGDSCGGCPGDDKKKDSKEDSSSSEKN